LDSENNAPGVAQSLAAPKAFEPNEATPSQRRDRGFGSI